MKYIKSGKYQTDEFMSKIMGPNPVKLTEELISDCKIPKGSVVCDLGSGQGLTSVFIAAEYGFKVYAAANRISLIIVQCIFQVFHKLLSEVQI